MVNPSAFAVLRLITNSYLAHFSVSSAIILPNSSGIIGIGVSIHFCFISPELAS